MFCCGSAALCLRVSMAIPFWLRPLCAHCPSGVSFSCGNALRLDHEFSWARAPSVVAVEEGLDFPSTVHRARDDARARNRQDRIHFLETTAPSRRAFRYRRIRVEGTRHRLIEVAFRRVDLELEAMVARELSRDECLELDVHDLRRRELGFFAARRRCLG